ncbi:hypothetical protein ABW19_dt0205997 [Dactylella cylindrospora]|nr:hypothetical protein ABW19_dt0205997 [Dactylella cylindrospora]
MAAEDDYFGDDDDFLDNLEELQELENAAVLASLTQKQRDQQQKPAAPQPPKNPYQISSKAGAYAGANRPQNQPIPNVGLSRASSNSTYQPSRTKGATPAPQIQTSTLSEEDQAIRAQFLARNQERQRLRQQQQEEFLANQRKQENAAAQQQAYITEQRQSQLSQAAGYSHRQRQLQPRGTYRQPTPSYITQPTLPSSPLHRSRLQNGTGTARVAGQGGTVNKSGNAGNTYTTANGTAARHYHTAKSNVPQQNVPIARPEEYERYDESEELWDTAAPTEMVLQEGGGTNTLRTSAFGTSAWISSNDIIEGGTVSNHATKDDMVDYDAEAEKHLLDNEVIMDVDEVPKGLAAEQLEELERLRKAMQAVLVEKDTLQKELKASKLEVQTRAGENSILRAKMEKAKIEHERHLESTRTHAHAQVLKANEDLSRIRSELVNMQSKYDFDHNDKVQMERELKQYQEKSKQTNKTSREVNPITPRKTRVSAFRDGFDDEEVGMGMRSSPPVGMPGSRGRGTPKSAKRKRKPNESPMKASQTLMLPIVHSNNNSQRSMMMDAGQEFEEDDYDALIDRLTLDDLGLEYDNRQEFMESILSYKPDEEEYTILEVMELYHYPSKAQESMGTLFMEMITPLEASAEYGEFPAGVCNVLIDLWNRCYTEKFVRGPSPIPYIGF